MSALFERLSAQLAAGHERAAPPLLSDERFAVAERTAPAAVLIAVTERSTAEGGPGVILTRRPATMRDHPGQVAFPGGKIEPGEDAVAAALREAGEELGMDAAAVQVIGTSDNYQTGTGFDVTPVLATIPAGLDLRPDPHEVESWFEAPLALLLDQSRWKENNVFWRGAQRRFYEMDYRGYRIWGVTAAICINLSRRLAWGDEGE